MLSWVESTDREHDREKAEYRIRPGKPPTRRPLPLKHRKYPRFKRQSPRGDSNTEKVGSATPSATSASIIPSRMQQTWLGTTTRYRSTKLQISNRAIPATHAPSLRGVLSRLHHGKTHSPAAVPIEAWTSDLDYRTQAGRDCSVPRCNTRKKNMTHAAERTVQQQHCSSFRTHTHSIRQAVIEHNSSSIHAAMEMAS